MSAAFSVISYYSNLFATLYELQRKSSHCCCVAEEHQRDVSFSSTWETDSGHDGNCLLHRPL